MSRKPTTPFYKVLLAMILLFLILVAVNSAIERLTDVQRIICLVVVIIVFVVGGIATWKQIVREEKNKKNPPGQ